MTIKQSRELLVREKEKIFEVVCFGQKEKLRFYVKNQDIKDIFQALKNYMFLLPVKDHIVEKKKMSFEEKVKVAVISVIFIILYILYKLYVYNAL